MKNITVVLLAIFIFVTGTIPSVAARKKHATPLAPQYAAIVIDANTGQVWHEENADAKTYPASLTKMMTLYLLFEALEKKTVKLTTRMPISKVAVNQIPSKLGLSEGRTLRVQDAMYGLITKSANDASIVIAEHLGGSVEQFAKMMTAKAHSLGMKSTIFKNPNGVPNKAQVTSARDMAILSKALYNRFPTYYRFFRTKSFTYNGQIHKNHNHLLGAVPGVDGIKTGYIAASGFNLAASAKRNGTRLIAVVMGGRSSAKRDARVEELLDQGFYMVSQQGEKKESNVYVVQDADTSLQASVSDDEGLPPIDIHLQSDEVESLEEQIQQEIPQQKVSKPKPKKIPHKLVTPSKSLRKSAYIVESSPRNWSVQLGAYKRENLANSKVAQILKKYKLTEGKPQVAVTTKRQKKLFQARVVNLTQGQAQNVCKLLCKKGEVCVAMKSGNRSYNVAMHP